MFVQFDCIAPLHKFNDQRPALPGARRETMTDAARFRGRVVKGMGHLDHV